VGAAEKVEGDSLGPRKRQRTLRTPQRARDAFIAALRDGLSIKAACEAAGIGRTTAYEMRAEDEAFAKAWDAALDDGTDVLEDEARRRALDGVERPVVAMGRVAKDDNGNIIKIREYSDTLMVTLLKARRPEKYRDRVSTELTGKGGGPVETKDVSARDLIAGRLAGLAARGAASGNPDGTNGQAG
jgi:hypothetical protein